MGSSIPEDRWRLLEIKQPSVAGIFASNNTDVRVRGQPVCYAIDKERNRHLLVPVGRGDCIPEDRRSAGVQISPHELIDGSKRMRFVDIVCAKPHLNEVFGFFIDEVIEALSKEEAAPVDTCCAVLDRWRELLRPDIGRTMSREALVGLLGELVCLRALARINPACLDVWTGPEGHRHDFCRAGLSLEVKTTTSRHGLTLTINGVSQLEALLGADLYLTAVRLEDVPHADLSLPALTDELLRLRADPTKLFEKLLAYGYDHSLADKYTDATFAFVDWRTYKVDGDFPRVIPASFAAGSVPERVTALTYEIDLSGEPPSPLSSVEQERVLQTLVART